MPNIELQRFMVFNSGEGQGEGQEGEKLLFHWTRNPNKQDTAEQINDICLCDACINVSDRLNENFQDANQARQRKKSLVLTFQTAMIVVVQVEPSQSIWMAAKVVALSEESGQPALSIPSKSIKRVINNIYSRFRMLQGGFHVIVNDLNEDNRSIVREKLRAHCEQYFGSILNNMHLSSLLSDDLLLYNNITHMDLDPLTSLKVISFTNHLVCMSANKIRHTLVIFNDQLLWSSLTLYDTRLLYNYLISDVIKNAVQEELSNEVDKVRRIEENFAIYLTELILERSFSFAGNNLNEMIMKNDLDDEMISEDPKLTKHYMTVFRSSNLTLCLILDEPNLADSIDNSLSGALASLARHVGQDYLEVMRRQKLNKPTKRSA